MGGPGRSSHVSRALAPQALPLARHAAAVLSDNFPERTLTIVVYPVPLMLSWLWTVARPLLPAKTARKVLILHGPGRPSAGAADEEICCPAALDRVVATELYALDDAHGISAGWLANRNAVVAATFGFASLIAHALFLDSGKWFDRTRALLPYALVGAAWLLYYKTSGYGTSVSVPPASCLCFCIERSKGREDGPGDRLAGFLSWFTS